MSLQRKLIIYSADIHLNFFRKIDYCNHVHVFMLYVPSLYSQGKQTLKQALYHNYQWESMAYTMWVKIFCF